MIKTKFAYYFFFFFWLNGFLIVLIGRREGGSLVALQFFDYLKRQLELFLRTFSLVKNIRDLIINLRNKLLYSYVLLRI